MPNTLTIIGASSIILGVALVSWEKMRKGSSNQSKGVIPRAGITLSFSEEPNMDTFRKKSILEAFGGKGKGKGKVREEETEQMELISHVKVDSGLLDDDSDSSTPRLSDIGDSSDSIPYTTEEEEVI